MLKETLIRHIEGFENYAVSADGRIWTCLRPWKTNGGYLQVQITDRQGTVKRVKVHREIAKAFVPNPEGHDTVCHIDGDVFNNTADNLRWDTKVGNEADKVKHGTLPHGEKHWNSKLTNEQAQDIIWLLELKRFTPAELAKLYNMKQTAIANLFKGKSWKRLSREG